MKNLKYIPLFILAILLASSCEDYLTKTIEFDEIGYEPLIVVNAKITDSIDVLRISISKNVSYSNNSNPEYDFIDGATVTVNIDGVDYSTTEIPGAIPNEDIYNHILSFPPDFVVSNKEYTIEVSHPDYTTCTSVTKVYPKPEITNLLFEPEARSNSEFGYTFFQDRTSFTIEDQSDERNYYRVQVFIDSPGAFYGLFTESDDPLVLSDNYGGLLFSDENFADIQELEVYTENISWYEEEVEMFLEIKNISESEYLFIQSYGVYLNAQIFDFFAEPVTLFTNIENGLGIFAAEQVMRFEL